MKKDDAVLKLQGVSREYHQAGQKIVALQKTDFSVRPGEFVAIIGPSGSGKSTFLTIAGGLQTPTSGKVSINGKEITNMNNKQRSAVRFSNIGFILQASNLVPFLSVEKQLRLRDSVSRHRFNERSALALFEELGIQNLRKKFPGDLSGGERQRAAIAKVLYGNPKVVLADEPTASLDTQKAYEVVELLARETHGQNRTTIMVTHDERLVEKCDKVYEMRDGVLTRRK